MKRRIEILAAILLLLAAAVLPGCTGRKPPEVVRTSEEAPEKAVLTASVNLLASYSRKSKEKPEVTSALRDACCEFSFDLFRQAAGNEDNGNVLISPLSAYCCLALAANGSDGETKAEMEKVLGLSVEELNRELYAFNKALPSSKDQKMSLANSLWFRKSENLVMEKAYLQSLADWYDAGLYLDPFDASTPGRINRWCGENTDGMIDQILDNPPDAAAMIYLLNALAFQGVWDKPYEEGMITQKTFRNADGTSASATMLRANEKILLENDSAIGFVKPYKNSEFSFAALLPADENADVYGFAASLTGDVWQDLWNSRINDATVKTMIPEFSAEAEYDLTDALKELGIRKIFSDEADLSKMAQSDTILSASRVRQKTWLKLDRKGTEAAAVTVMDVTGAAMPVKPAVIREVYLDRPFVYLILRDEIPVFIGVTASLNP